MHEPAFEYRYQKLRNRIVPDIPIFDLQFYGAAAKLQTYDGAETIIAGPYETGKTISALHKLHQILCAYPNVHALAVRQTYKSLIHSAIVTFNDKILLYPPEHPKCPIIKYGGKKPEWYDYPNGSRLVLGGMDTPDKFLSAEFDVIYVLTTIYVDS